MTIPLERTQAEYGRNMINAYEENWLQVFLGSPNGVKSEITHDAWGKPKSVMDYSIFHSLFTYNVNTTFWKWFEDWVENINIPASTRILSTNWELELKTTAVNWSYTELISLRSPRYQPNRWHLYSTTIFSDNDIGKAWTTFEFWIWNSTAGSVVDWAYFEITDNKIYAVVKSSWSIRVRQDITADLLENTGLTINDLNFWHLFDIQFQWRGVWDFFFYVDLKLVYRVNFLWTLNDVTISNPQLPAFYRVKNNTAWEVVTMRSWCIDITSEWGKVWGLTDASRANNGIVTIPNDLLRHPLILIRVPNTFKSKINTRNSRLLRVTATPFWKDMRIWFSVTRDSTAIWWTLWSTAFQGINTNSSLEYIDYSVNTETQVSFDFTKSSVSYQAASQAWRTISADEPNKDLDLYLSGWDIVCLFVQNIKTGTWWEAEWILEFWEEI